MLGRWSERFNQLWYQQTTGLAVSAVGASVRCEEHPWRACTLDGYVGRLEAVWEAKHTNAFCKADEVLQRYMPQLQHNMAVVGAKTAVLSVIFGNHRWEAFEIGADWLYQEELLIAEARFWDCVKNGVEPLAAPPPPVPRVVGTREVCFKGNNTWAAAAADWLKHRQAAKLHATATSSLKSLIEEDVGRAFGHCIEAKRSKSGAITIRELAS
jgi:predicted phage-related endonuclease